MPSFQQVLTIHLLFTLLTNPAWLGSFGPPMSRNPRCRLRLAFPLTTMTTRLLTQPHPLHQGFPLETRWEPPPSIPIQDRVNTDIWLLCMVFMLLFMTAGEYGGLR